MDINELFWNSSVEEMKKGYIEGREEYICIFCGEKSEKGIIYEEENKLLEAEKFIKLHINKKHGDTFNYLINLNKKFTGLTDVQKNILEDFYQGLSDKDIASKSSSSTSTIRNHRFKLRERERQSKLFLVLMELLKESKISDNNILDNETLKDMHKTATTIDDRYNITKEEKEKNLSTYFDSTGKLKEFPSKEKKKIIILEEICRNFKKDNKYTERELNIILKRIYEDNATVRRALIEYGFMDRNKDCSYYWVKE